MIVQNRIARLKLDCAFQMLRSSLVIPQPVVRPAKAVDDVAFIWLHLRSPSDHIHGEVEVLTPINIGIADIIQQ